MDAKTHNQRMGKQGEAKALDFLQERGYAIIATNYRTARGEIDIVARDRQTLVFIEVKARRDLRYGWPGEAVHAAKQAKIRRTALAFLAAHSISCREYRFDVLALLFSPAEGWRIEHIINAF